MSGARHGTLGGMNTNPHRDHEAPGARVRARREARGVTQRELAHASSLSRQSVGAIEAGRAMPAVDVALRLARALDCTVEELFGDASPTLLEVDAGLSISAPSLDARVVLGEIAGRWVAHAVSPQDPSSADALVVRAVDGARGGRVVVEAEPLRSVPELRRNLLVAGCAVGLGLIADRHTQRELGRCVWLPTSSARAIELLSRGRVHVAAVHSALGRASGAELRRIAQLPTRVVRFASWQAGLVVPAGNPRAIRGVGELGRRGLRVATREAGAGARRLLDRELARTGVTLTRPLEAAGHREVASLVSAGAVDAGIATRDVAIAQGLGFVPLAEERIDLVIPTDLLADPRLECLLDTLSAHAARRELEALGYDTRESGLVVEHAA